MCARGGSGRVACEPVLGYDRSQKTREKEIEERKMKNMNFRTLEECIECYGRGELVAINNLPQIIFYTSHGCQPKFVCEDETKHGRITAWFLKNENSFIYKKWMNNKPKKD